MLSADVGVIRVHPKLTVLFLIMRQRTVEGAAFANTVLSPGHLHAVHIRGIVG